MIKYLILAYLIYYNFKSNQENFNQNFRNTRLIEVEFNNYQELKSIYIIENTYLPDLIERNIQIFFTKSDKFSINLYGYDKRLKYTTSNVSEFPNKFFSLIDEMPMRTLDKNYPKPEVDISYKCSLPNNRKTNHCFNDRTHHTCCMLGKDARKYADESGNPIGKASIKAFEEFYGFTPKENTLTPWCTCIGSMVCTFYGNKFDDGTHIKLINGKKKTYYEELNEKKIRREEEYIKHKTPGIN